MQEIKLYLRADSVAARPVDAYNQPVTATPSLTRGMRARLVLVLLDGAGNALDLSSYAAWSLVLDDDWLTTTAPKLAVYTGITVSGNEVTVPLTETNTEELIAALGNSESITLGGELAGFEAGETSPGMVLQFNLAVRNRRGDAGTGTPEPVADGALSATQIRALLAAELPFRGVYSATGAYAEGDVVICDGSLWQCVMDVAAGEDYPEDASAVWFRVLAGSRFRGDYDATISYANGDFVTYSGSLWESEMDDNRGWYPSTDGLEWTLVVRGSRLTGDYAAGTTYAAGDYVISGGALWKCESTSPMDAPSADSAEWSLAVGGGTSGGGVAALPLAMTPAVMDTTYDIVGYLDSDCTVLTGATRVHGITKLHIWCVAANPASSGNLELEVSCGSVSDTVELPVTGTETMQTIELYAAATGTLTLTRYVGGAMETFPADVTAIITGVLYE